jgi:predicted O-linked N-acetylglucosamine transferase (SPINDLY family)
MERNRGSEAVRAAGEAFLDHASTPLLLQATCDLKPYATARGRLVAAIAHTRSGDSKVVAAPSEGRPLRIGILSRDFADNADNRALLPVVNNLDPERVELVLFAEKFGASPIELAFRKAAAAFNHLPAQRMARLELCAQAGCDVIIFSGDIARASDEFAGLALQRLAPLQAVLPSTPFTTGLPAVDLRVIGEATAEPSTEQLALLPGSGLAFPDSTVPGSGAPMPAVRSEFGLPAEGSLFISAANPDLFSAEILGAWSRLLRAVPGSSLLLILPESADPFLAEQRPTRIAGFGGVGASRVVVVLDDARRGLSLDGIYLDTFPTSDPEALAAAVRSSLPAVTWSGATHRSRTGSALLHELGGGALVAEDESGYISRASELAVDEEHRAETGTRLASRSTGSDLLAMADALTGLFERAFGEVLGNSCRPRTRAPIRLGFTAEEVESIRENTLKALAMGCPGKAVATTRLWLQGEPYSADARLLHARALRLTGKNARALTYALAALTGNEDEPEAWLEAAEALRANGQSDEAISAYEAALKLDGSCVEAWIALSELATAAGHHDFANEAARAARELSPTDPRLAALALTA